MNTVKTGGEWLVKGYRYPKTAEITYKRWNECVKSEQVSLPVPWNEEFEYKHNIVIQQNKVSTLSPKRNVHDMDYLPRLHPIKYTQIIYRT